MTGEATLREERLGPYRLLTPLGEAGGCDLYLARPEPAGGDALCVVRTFEAADDGDGSRPSGDVPGLWTRLCHPHLRAVLEVGEVDERPWVAMEHVAGRDLRDVVARARDEGEGVPAPIALHVVSSVLDALHYLHRFSHPVTGAPLGLRHGDVSAAAVTLGVDGEVKLDVGGVVPAGGPRPGEADDADDGFRAAALLYALLVAPDDDNDGDDSDDDGDDTAQRPGLARLDEDLRDVLGAALAEEPAHRVTDCGELRARLLAYQAGRPESAGAAEVSALMARLFPDERGRWRALLAAPADADEPPPPLPVSAADIGLEPLVPALEGFERFEGFESFEGSDPSTPVGRLRLAKAKPGTAKPGTPRPELLDRLGLAPASSEAPAREPARPLPAAAAPLGRRAPVLWFASAGLVVAGALASVGLLRGDAGAGTTPPPAAVVDDAPFAARPAGATTASARARPAGPLAPGPRHSSREQLRRLERDCRQEVPCAARLLARSAEGAPPDFWREVEGCLRQCGR